MGGGGVGHRKVIGGWVVGSVAASLAMGQAPVQTPAHTSVQTPALQLERPLEVLTPWGQRVVPNLDNHVDLETCRQLRDGQAWAEGAEIGRRLRADFTAGRLRLERYPWRVLDGVHVLGHQGFEQLSYLIDTGDGLLLVDPSLDRWHEEWLAQIRLLGHQPSDVKWVLLTHAHIDHGQSAHRWKALGARLLVGAGDVRPMESCNRIVATWVEPQADGRCTPVTVDVPVHDGDVITLGRLALHALATPGHTPGSIALYFERAGRHVLISGDIALHNGRHAWMDNPFADWRQYLTSLEKLTRFSIDGQPVRFDVLLPGHGTIDLDQAQRSVNETLRVVRTLVARREAGERISWIEPYPWNWAQGQRCGPPATSPVGAPPHPAGPAQP